VSVEAVAEPHHLHGADVLLLLHVDVGQVEPHVADVRRGLPHLGEHVPRLPEVALVGQDGSCTPHHTTHTGNGIDRKGKSTTTLERSISVTIATGGRREGCRLRTYAVGGVEVLGVVSQDLFVYGKSAILMSLFLS